VSQSLPILETLHLTTAAAASATACHDRRSYTVDTIQVHKVYVLAVCMPCMGAHGRHTGYVIPSEMSKQTSDSFTLCELCKQLPPCKPCCRPCICIQCPADSKQSFRLTQVTTSAAAAAQVTMSGPTVTATPMHSVPPTTP
jgi:hypothetical protein